MRPLFLLYILHLSIFYNCQHIIVWHSLCQVIIGSIGLKLALFLWKIREISFAPEELFKIDKRRGPKFLFSICPSLFVVNVPNGLCRVLHTLNPTLYGCQMPRLKTHSRCQPLLVILTLPKPFLHNICVILNYK